MHTGELIELAHGGGGQLSREFIEREIVSRFGSGPLRGLPDAAALDLDGARLRFTTDAFVVQPLFFPGGDIGRLAVHGTVNDLAAAGARPLWLSLALILEEGLELADLRRILDSVAAAARACEVQVVTGDTKVVARGQCDGMYVTSAGIGRALPGLELSPERVRPGDRVLVSGPIAEHGTAIMAARQGMSLGGEVKSDTGPVHELAAAAACCPGAARWMRDPTRGGLAAVLNELVERRRITVELEQEALPLSGPCRDLLELLGLDPLQVASEGRLLLVCAPAAEQEILRAWRALPAGRGACRIGEVRAGDGQVVMHTITGGRRLVDVPRGELLPRIC